ncbi:hypothetical protein FDP41_013595 [Naegleria fowleri]|uniref:Autocrine proliferation repressor protein A n=1 Tax=Naegleria fowleri TaxID=5763 RepID=A0A6A5C0E6_NAEFO|nr:uncharacterized protein FDP41_013595 [Naegleria fowleri]KAF0980381.1 hypothetical protein FDP41_013595 [Naegleria fowleri]
MDHGGGQRSSEFSIPHRYETNSFRTALDDFMDQPDPNFHYQIFETFPVDINGIPIKQKGGPASSAVATCYVLNMTSQTWLSDRDILNGRYIWWHYHLVIVPNDLNRNLKHALMWMIGKHNTDLKPYLGDLPDLTKIAVSTRSIVTELQQVPNQPIVFAVDPKHEERSEDGVVALTWRYFLNDTSKPYWIAHLPMTRAGKRGLDTIQSFARKQLNVNIETFTVMGGSKKGWTTWLLAAVDHRVTNIIPMVIATLNLQKCLIHTYDSLCDFPIAMDSYIDQGITSRVKTTQFSQLAGIIDPLIYRDRFANIPKLLIYALGDEFFWVDLSLFSFPFLTGGLNNKRLKYLPNTGHNMNGSDMLDAVHVSYYAYLYGIDLPVYDFHHIDRGHGIDVELRILNGTIPRVVKLWQATNENARDFRITTIGKAYTSSVVPPSDDSGLVYNVSVNNPKKGYTAFMMEMEFDVIQKPGIPVIRFTTSAYITPTSTPCVYPY